MKIFYQSSLPRSGSTLLQNIIGQNPDFYVTPTSGVLELVFGARANYTSSAEFLAQDSEEMKKGFLRFCRDGMNGFYDAITDKPYVVDKSRGWGIHSRLLEEIYGEKPKIICMVRNMKQIIASMEKIFRNNPDQNQNIVDWTTGRGTTTEKRLDVWMGNDGGNGVPVGMALSRLQQMELEGLDKDICFVRFEDLCTDPKKTLNRVSDYLGVEHFEYDFKNVEQITQEDDSVYGISKDLHTIKKEVKPFKNYYLDILGKDMCEWIDTRYEKYQKRFGYK